MEGGSGVGLQAPLLTCGDLLLCVTLSQGLGGRVGGGRDSELALCTCCGAHAGSVGFGLESKVVRTKAS